jgi:NodT family efflux transporter outer membrane factor (OMF) lipoprotein
LLRIAYIAKNHSFALEIATFTLRTGKAEFLSGWDWGLSGHAKSPETVRWTFDAFRSMEVVAAIVVEATGSIIMPKLLSNILLSVTAALLASSCAVGPNFLRPAAPEIDRYTAEPTATHTSSAPVADGQVQRFEVGKDVDGQWWRMFHSKALDALVEESLQHNPNVDAAKAALRVAQELTYAQYGAFFPFIQANYVPSRQQVPTGQVSSPLAAPPTGNTTVFNLQTAQVLVSYTFDVWGVNQRTIESLQAQTDFQRFQAEAAYITLTSNVVLAAINEASLRAQIEATNKMIDANRKALDILRNQFGAGYAARTDVAAQEAALAQIVATLPPLRKALQQNRDLIAALAGRFPSQDPPEKFLLAALRLPVDLPVSIPSNLINQRPDVRSAEEQVHSASAQVGVAIGNMLPQFTLSAAGGYTQALFATSLISQANQLFTLSGGITQPVFDGFNLWHREQSAQAALDQSVAQYKVTVIGAVQNVADSLRALQNDADALKAAHDFERASKVSLDLAQQQIQSGYINVLLLLTAETTYQQALIGLVQAQAARLSDTVALYQALGGGWWNNDLFPSTPKPTDSTTTTVQAQANSAAPKLASAPSVDVAAVPAITPVSETESHN